MLLGSFLLNGGSVGYDEYMSRFWFEEILSGLVFSAEEDKDTQILDYLDAVNNKFQAALRPGDFLCLMSQWWKPFISILKER